MLKGTAKVTFSKFLGQLWGNIRGICQYIVSKRKPDHNILWSGTYGRGDAIRTRNLRFWRPLLYR